MGDEEFILQRAPIQEIAIELKFLTVDNLSAIALIKLHSLWIEEFPKIQEMPIINEENDDIVSLINKIKENEWKQYFRIWFLSEDDHTLVQVQRDRIVFNWRSLSKKTSHYPGYNQIKERFRQIVEIFAFYIKNSYDTQLLFEQIKISYSNNIDLSNIDASDVLTLIKPYGQNNVTVKMTIFGFVSYDDNNEVITSLKAAANNNNMDLLIHSHAPLNRETNLKPVFEKLDICHCNALTTFSASISTAYQGNGGIND